MSYRSCLACTTSMKWMGTWAVLHMVWGFVSFLASTVFTYLTLSFILEAKHIQAMDGLDDEPDNPAGYNAIDAPPLMVAQFSSDEEDDEAEEEDVDSSL